MKKTICCLFILATLLNMLFVFPAYAERDPLKSILNEYPGYKFDKNTMHLGTKDYNFSTCIPELKENGCYLYVSVTNFDSAPTFLLVLSVGEQMHDFSVTEIMTASTDYKFTTDNTNSIYCKTLNIPCSPNGKTPYLIRHILESETVTFRLISNGDFQDLCFTLNDSQRHLIDLSYSYYLDALKKADSNKLLMQEWIIDASLSFIVTQEPHKESVGAHNSNGGLFPWCASYIDDRYPNMRQGKNDFNDFLQIIITKENLSMDTETIYSKLKVAESKDDVYTILDEIIKQNSTPSTDLSVTDEIREYKKLLDEGIITQEEFDAKKKQLMGL